MQYLSYKHFLKESIYFLSKNDESYNKIFVQIGSLIIWYTTCGIITSGWEF